MRPAIRWRRRRGARERENKPLFLSHSIIDQHSLFKTHLQKNKKKFFCTYGQTLFFEKSCKECVVHLLIALLMSPRIPPYVTGMILHFCRQSCPKLRCLRVVFAKREKILDPLSGSSESSPRDVPKKIT